MAVEEIKFIIANHEEKTVTTNLMTIETSLNLYLNSLCIENGSTFEGRIDSFRNLTHTKQKPCIYVNDHVLLMPLSSINSETVYLINYWWFQKLKRIGNHETLVYFKDNTTIVLECDARVLIRQLERCGVYLSRMI